MAAGKQVPGLSTTAIDAFMDGMHAGVLVAAAVAFVGALIAFIWLPARASYDALADAGTDSGTDSKVSVEPAEVADPAVVS